MLKNITIRERVREYTIVQLVQPTLIQRCTNNTDFTMWKYVQRVRQSPIWHVVHMPVVQNESTPSRVCEKTHIMSFSSLLCCCFRCFVHPLYVFMCYTNINLLIPQVVKSVQIQPDFFLSVPFLHSHYTLLPLSSLSLWLLLILNKTKRAAFEPMRHKADLLWLGITIHLLIFKVSGLYLYTGCTVWSRER